MSPFLETWYHQADCKECGEPLCFIEDENGRWVPTESNGNDHRFTCSARNPPHLTYKPPDPLVKPKDKRLAMEFEIAHEGQKTLGRWCK